MEKKIIEEKTIKILSEIIEDPEVTNKITSDTNILNDIGLSSLQMMRFILAIEDEFGIVVEFGSFSPQSLSSLSAFSKFVSEEIILQQQ